MDFPEPSTFYGEIRRYSFTFKVPKNYIPQQHALIIKVCSGSADMRQGTALCKCVTLYSGKYASMYIGIVLQQKERMVFSHLTHLL